VRERGYIAASFREFPGDFGSWPPLGLRMVFVTMAILDQASSEPRENTREY